MVESSAAVSATRVTPPRPPNRYLSRGRLLDRLESAVAAGQGFVLVSAPAGSGKSTLVNGWLDAHGRAAAWLQVDEGDDDPFRFWAGIAAALSDALPGVADAVGAASSDGLAAVVDAIVNEIVAADTDIVLVIDDYHLVSNPDVHRGVERLVTLRPPRLVVVVSTRLDPPFRLGRLRVSGELAEIRAADLRFDLAEAGWLLDAEAFGLGHADLARLAERTEGWAAGLVLASLSLRDVTDVAGFVASFQGDDRLIATYLTEEFLDSIDPDQRRRLLEVSILERCSGPLIDAVCGTDDGTAWLRGLAASNQLVIALDRSDTWFRLHHLLRDLLRAELAHEAPDRLASLHEAAARWYADDGDLMPAIDHFLHAGCLVEAADLVADNATMLLNIGRVYTVTRYIDRLGDLIDRHAGLAIVHGWVSFVTGRFAEAERALAVAARLDTDGEDAGLIQSLTAMIHLADGDVTSALGAIDRQTPTTEPTHPMVLGAVRVMGGRYDDARPYLALANEMAASRPDHFVAAVTPAYEAIAELEEGRAEAARRLADAAIAHADLHRIGRAAQLAPAHSVVGRTTADPDTAVTAALQGVQLARRAPERVMLLYALASAADVAFVHEHGDAPALLAEARSVADQCVDPGIAGRYLARVESRHGHAVANAGEVVGTVEELTDRELAVLRYLPSKLSQREIAAELYVSLNTVKTHCRAVYRKLGVDGRQAAVQAAREHDLL